MSARIGPMAAPSIRRIHDRGHGRSNGLTALLMATLLLALGLPMAAASDKEETVYLDYTQDALDRAYSQRFWASDIRETMARWQVESETSREGFAFDTYRYGASSPETLDLFRTQDPEQAPTLIFIHGGAWRGGSKDGYAFLADAFVPFGANLAVLDFANVPEVRLPEMAAQTADAVAWIYENAAALDIDGERLYVAGHSSGGHLAGVVLTRDWRADGLPADLIKGGVPISGMFDLEPVMLSARRHYLDIDASEQVMLSPIRHVHRIRSPILLAYGDQESPEFQRQSRAFKAALDQSPYPSELLVLSGTNHFEILDDLAAREGRLAQAVRTMMGLSNRL